jgi:hypothetical protein
MWGTVCMLTFYMMLNDINILQPGPKLGCITAPLSTSQALLSEHVKVVSFQVLFCLQHTSTSQESSLSVLQFSGQHLMYDFLYNLLNLRLTSVWVARVISNLLAAVILEMRGVGGKAGWFWLFLIEGLLTFVIGVIVSVVNYFNTII